MLLSSIVPASLCVDRVVISGQGIEMYVTSRSTFAACPSCGAVSGRVHSRYTRTLHDLPISDQTARLIVTVRRFRCDNRTCPRRTFAEPLEEIAPAHARRTRRRTDALRSLGLIAGGEAGSRLSAELKLTTSPDTLLRILVQTPLPVPVTPRVLGLDDWALARGRRYGTLLVDLERHQRVDLLPDRSAETLAAWLRCHPGIEVISRDRSPEYARGAREGAPDAHQVADRWHLLKSLRETLEHVLNRLHAQLRSLPALASTPDRPPPLRPRRLRPPSAPERARQQASRQRRQDDYQAVHHLLRQGVPQRTIARQLGLSRTKVRRFAQASCFPERGEQRPRPSRLDPYLTFLQQRWAEGCTNASQLWRELRACGYSGCRQQVARWAQAQRTQPAPTTPNWRRSPPLRPAAPDRSPSLSTVPAPRQLAWLLLKRGDELDAKEQALLSRLQQLPALRQSYTLAQRFLTIVRQRLADELDGWLAACLASDLPDFQTFAASLQRDLPAVRNALSMEWSNGQLEGQVNRLKVLKRQMYGRASFSLLRLRVLANSP